MTVTVLLVLSLQGHKIEGEVGITVPKSTQTRVVGIITCIVHPYACFSHYGAMSCIDVFINIIIDLQG